MITINSSCIFTKLYFIRISNFINLNNTIIEVNEISNPDEIQFRKYTTTIYRNEYEKQILQRNPNELYKLINNNKGDDNESYWNAIKTGINKEFSKEFKELYLKMVAFKPSERPSIEDILNSEWLKEINNLKQEEENNLENEVRNYLENIYNEIKKENEEIKVAVKLQENDYKTRGGDNEIKFFNHNVKLKKISDKRININHYLILNGDFSKVDFMNSLANELKEIFNFEK